MLGIQVIGIGGLLGKALFKFFNEQKQIVFGTSHQKHLANPSNISYLDLLSPNFDFIPAIASEVQFSILCSGETDIDKCKTETEMSESFNVNHTIQLIESLWVNSITPVFISSDAVFDGQTGDYSEDDTCRPITEYGSQKRRVEEFLIASNKPWLIVRLCKVFDVNYKDNTLITNWFDSFQAGNSIKCASDQFIAPTYVMDICKAIGSLISRGKTGIYHACSPEIFSRYDLGLRVAQHFEADQRLVKKCSIFDFNFIEPRSCYNTLNQKKLICELNFSFSTMNSCCELISNNYEKHKT